MEIETLVANQRSFYMEGKTLPLSFRREALDRLERAIVAREAEINAALYADLGKAATES